MLQTMCLQFVHFAGIWVAKMGEVCMSLCPQSRTIGFHGVPKSLRIRFPNFKLPDQQSFTPQSALLSLVGGGPSTYSSVSSSRPSKRLSIPQSGLSGSTLVLTFLSENLAFQ
jgi:hypothetical protein